MSHAIKKVSVVAFYNHFEGVKQSVRKLKKDGFDIKKLSIAGKGYHSCPSLFMISGLGPISVSGPLVAAIVRAFGRGVNIRSLRALHEGLYNIGIPKERVFQYESALKNGFCLVCARGPVDKIAEVKHVFDLSKAIEITVHYQ
ncbi:MAG: hypothetical protein H8E17_10670 [Deltaproteobacteria bacterium]|nr:hypothetical protein [Deltaproteobacteria bacterium]